VALVTFLIRKVVSFPVVKLPFMIRQTFAGPDMDPGVEGTKVVSVNVLAVLVPQPETALTLNTFELAFNVLKAEAKVTLIVEESADAETRVTYCGSVQE
jgi:hypothetical protein